MRKESATTQPYTQTSRGISVLADCTPGYVLRLAKAGLLPHVLASNGTYLYPVTVVATVKKLKAAGLARRGSANGSTGRVAATAAG